MRDITNEDGTIILQGFREGGGEQAYVYLEVSEEIDGVEPQVAALKLSPQSADELGEYLRQEAEFARSVREGKGNE